MGSSPRIDVQLRPPADCYEIQLRGRSGWLSCLAAAPGPWLTIVPNYTYRLLASEDDGSRRPFDELLAHHGYALEVKEPMFPDAALRDFMGVTDYFFLFRWRETKTGVAVASHVLS
jgi:hypothetical protein